MREDEDLTGVCHDCGNYVRPDSVYVCSLPGGMEACQKQIASPPEQQEQEGEPEEVEKWLPTAESVNALPEPIRKYVHDIASRCDPAGEVRELTIARDTCRTLEAERDRLISDHTTVCESNRLMLQEIDRYAGALREGDLAHQRWHEIQKYKARIHTLEAERDRHAGKLKEIHLLSDGKYVLGFDSHVAIREIHRISALTDQPDSKEEG